MSDHHHATIWRKSSRCASNGCVEVAADQKHFLVRDSKDRNSPELMFTTAAWREFIDRVKSGELDPR